MADTSRSDGPSDSPSDRTRDASAIFPEHARPEHARNDGPPDALNFGRIGRLRRGYLDDQAARYIDAADTSPFARARSLDYHGFAGILTHLAAREDLDDLEKAFVWSAVADRKGDANPATKRFEGARYAISLDGAHEAIRGRRPFREWHTPNRSVVGFMDADHGFGNPAPGEGQSLAYASGEDADRRVRGREDALGADEGDIQASLRLVAAFRRYRTSPWGGKFASFADAWQRGMLQDRGRDARDIGRRFNAAGG